MRKTRCRSAAVVLLAGLVPVAAAGDPDQKFWAAVREGNVARVAKFLERGVAPESRIVALSVSVAGDQDEAFVLLWNHDNRDIAAEALDYALCHAYRNSAPAVPIQAVLDGRALTIDACCQRKQEQPFCARRPIRLTDREYPPTVCASVFTDESQVPQGATRVAVLWDERVAVLEQASTARYGPRKITKVGARDWALEFASIIGALGADAILITQAGTDVATSSSLTPYPGAKGEASLSGFVFGTTTDRVEIVGIRTTPVD